MLTYYYDPSLTSGRSVAPDKPTCRKNPPANKKLFVYKSHIFIYV